MRTLRIGLVDIDTSHPEAFLPLLRSMNLKIAGCFDSGSVHSREAVAAFCHRHDIAHVDSPEALIPLCDLVFIHSCNWDVHIARARPFIEAGKGVFLDKPLAGNPADWQILLEWERQGGRITGGSCAWHAREIQNHCASQPPPHTVWCGCGVDDFNYAIHAYSAAFALLGPGCSKVRASRQGRIPVSHLLWEDGRQAFLMAGPHSWLPVHVTAVCGEAVAQFSLSTDDIYRPMLAAILPYLSGETERAPISMADLLEPERALLAARASLDAGESWFALKDVDLLPHGFDGAAFNERYRQIVSR